MKALFRSSLAVLVCWLITCFSSTAFGQAAAVAAADGEGLVTGDAVNTSSSGYSSWTSSHSANNPVRTNSA